MPSVFVIYNNNTFFIVVSILFYAKIPKCKKKIRVWAVQ